MHKALQKKVGQERKRKKTKKRKEKACFEANQTKIGRGADFPAWDKKPAKCQKDKSRDKKNPGPLHSKKVLTELNGGGDKRGKKKNSRHEAPSQLLNFKESRRPYEGETSKKKGNASENKGNQLWGVT